MRASFTLVVAAIGLAAGLGAKLYPPLGAAPGPRLSTAWVATFFALALASILGVVIARPRRAPLLVLGLLPGAALVVLALPLLALLEPAVREVLVPSAVETAAALGLVVAALRAAEARIERVVPRAPSMSRTPNAAESLAITRSELARDVLEVLVRPGRIDGALAVAAFSIAIGVVAFVVLRAKVALVETWMPALAAALVASGAGAVVTARIAGRAKLLELALGAGVLVARSKDLFALARVRRWQIDPELLAAPGPVELVALADVSAERVLAVVDALLESDEGIEHRSVRAALEARSIAPVGAAAVRRERSLLRGTVEGQRWYVGPERAVADEDARAIDPTTSGAIQFLRDKAPIVWLVGSPEEGVVGALGIGLGVDARMKAVAGALHATVMPGAPDATRRALAEAAGITCDGPPIAERDATLLAEGSAPPSGGLRVRGLGEDLHLELDDDPCLRVLPADAPRLALLGAAMVKALSRSRVLVLLVLLLPPLFTIAAAWGELLGGAVAGGIALVGVALAASPLRK